MRRLNADTIVAILLLVLSAALLKMSFDFRTPPFVTVSSAIWPRIVLGALASLSLVYLVQSVRAGPDAVDATLAPFLTRHRNAVICFVLFGLFLLSLPWLGMLLGGVLYVFVMQEMLGPRDTRSRLVHLAIAVISVGGMWALFRFALHVILPEGEILRILTAMLDNIAIALANVFAIKPLILMTVGVLAGLIAGAIPGFTITMAVVLTLPFTFGMSPIDGLSTMIGVYVGALTGGLFSCALIGIPGTPSAVATTFDAFPMARKGRPGLALGIGIWASFFAGIISAVLLVVLAPPLAQIGLEFGPWDYFALVLFSLTMAASLADEALLKGLISGLVGLLMACVGEDAINGVARFTFGLDDLRAGFDFLPVLVGLFAFSQLIEDLADPEQAKKPLMPKGSAITNVEHWAAIVECVRHWPSTLRSTLIGLFIGILPAVGGSISNILAYDQEKKMSKTPERFGTGIPEGIIASEAANNSTAGGALITMMALGIPGDAVTAIMLGALTIHNVAPSPSFIGNQPVLAYGIFIAYFISNFITLAVNPVGLRLFVLVMRVPMYAMASVILAYCAIGVFSLGNAIFDIWSMLLFGLIGYAMVLLKFPVTPMILGVVLGPIAETNLGRAFATSDDPTLFLSRPWSLFFLILAAFSTFFPWYQKARARGTANWTRFYMPGLCVVVALPVFMMDGLGRPAFALALVALGLWLAWRRRAPAVAAS